MGIHSIADRFETAVARFAGRSEHRTTRLARVPDGAYITIFAALGAVIAVALIAGGVTYDLAKVEHVQMSTVREIPGDQVILTWKTDGTTHQATTSATSSDLSWTEAPGGEIVVTAAVRPNGTIGEMGGIAVFSMLAGIFGGFGLIFLGAATGAGFHNGVIRATRTYMRASFSW